VFIISPPALAASTIQMQGLGEYLFGILINVGTSF
jgi:hypothetical protein